jgi:hypothetical protein
MELPIESRPRPKPSFDGDTFLIFGPPKTGKTTLALSFPNALVIDCERGCRKYGGRIVDLLAHSEDEGKPPIEGLREIFRALKSDCPFDTIVIDTVDALSRWFEASTVRSLNVKHRRDGKKDKTGRVRHPYTSIGDPEYGLGYSDHRNNVMAVLEGFQSLGKMLVLVCHSKTMITEELGEQAKVIDLPGKLGHLVPAMADHLGTTLFDKDLGAVVEFSGYEVENAKGFTIREQGSRLAELQGKKFPNKYEELKGAIE